MKFDASIGERRISLELEGISLKRQRDALHMLVQTFFEDLDEAIETPIPEQSKPEEIFEDETADNVIEEDMELDLPQKVGAFTIADVVKNYNHDIWGLEIGPVTEETVQLPEELQKAVDNGLNKHNYKIGDNNAPMYQVYYICTGCGHKGKRYIPLGRKSITCHSCSKRMLVRPALDQEFPHNDIYGNMFISGDFMRPNERNMSLEEREKLKKQNKVYMS